MSNLIKLGELCHFINGGAWSDKEYVSYGIPVIKVTNCKPSGFELTNISYLPYALEKNIFKIDYNFTTSLLQQLDLIQILKTLQQGELLLLIH